MSKSKNNIIVTGGYGFIGSHLVKSLVDKEDAHVINIDNLSYSSNTETLKDINDNHHTHLNIDIGSFTNFEEIYNEFNPLKVFHLAAESHVDRSIDGPQEFIKTNINGTYNLLQGLNNYISSNRTIDKNLLKFINVSTDEVYGSISKGKSVETDNVKPNSPYSASKASADLLVRAWSKTYKLPVITTRCTNNYGAWQFPEKLIPLSINKILNNEKIPIYGEGKQVRDWIHVQDHVDALIKLSNSPKTKIGDIYNIGIENEISNIELIRKICSIFDKHFPKQKGSYSDLINFVKDRPGHDMRYALSNQKIKNDIGWEPKKAFDEGIQETINWYKNNPSFFSHSKEIYDGSRIGTVS